MSFILLGILNSQAAGAVGGGTYDLLETTILGSSQSSVTFSSLNSTYGSTYKHLQIRMVGRTDRSAGSDVVNLNLNNDTTSSYAYHALLGDGSSVFSIAASSVGFGRLYRASANTASANAYGAIVVDLLDCFSATKNTTVRYLGGTDTDVGLGSVGFFKTNAVDEIDLEPGIGTNFLTGSRFSLYGIKAA